MKYLNSLLNSLCSFFRDLANVNTARPDLIEQIKSEAVVTSVTPVYYHQPDLFDDLPPQERTVKPSAPSTGTKVDQYIRNKFRKKRKVRDATPFSREDYDYVIRKHDNWLNWNKAYPNNPITMDELVNQLNNELGLNKSRSPYQTIWNGKVNRNALKPTRKGN